MTLRSRTKTIDKTVSFLLQGLSKQTNKEENSVQVNEKQSSPLF